MPVTPNIWRVVGLAVFVRKVFGLIVRLVAEPAGVILDNHIVLVHVLFGLFHHLLLLY